MEMKEVEKLLTRMRDMYVAVTNAKSVIDQSEAVQASRKLQGVQVMCVELITQLDDIKKELNEVVKDSPPEGSGTT